MPVKLSIFREGGGGILIFGEIKAKIMRSSAHFRLGRGIVDLAANTLYSHDAPVEGYFLQGAARIVCGFPDT
jgi:hypothetical protein